MCRSLYDGTAVAALRDNDPEFLCINSFNGAVKEGHYVNVFIYALKGIDHIPAN
jgi:hypothetical protein